MLPLLLLLTLPKIKRPRWLGTNSRLFMALPSVSLRSLINLKSCLMSASGFVLSIYRALPQKSLEQQLVNPEIQRTIQLLALPKWSLKSRVTMLASGSHPWRSVFSIRFCLKTLMSSKNSSTWELWIKHLFLLQLWLLALLEVNLMALNKL